MQCIAFMRATDTAVTSQANMLEALQMFRTYSGLFSHDNTCYMVSMSPGNTPAVAKHDCLNDALSSLHIKLNQRQQRRRARHHAGIALGSEHTTLHHLRLAKLSGEELRQAVHWKIGKDTSQSEDLFISDICSVSETETPDGAHLDVLGAALSSGHSQSLCQEFDTKGITLQAIDTVPGAIARCFDYQSPNIVSNPVTVVVLCESRQAKLLACSGGELLFAHLLTTPQVCHPADSSTPPSTSDHLASRYDMMELLRELRAGLHFILDRIDTSPDAITGTLLSIGCPDDELLWTLDQCARIEFQDFRKLLRPDLQDCLSSLPKDFDLGAASVAYGMALHPAVTGLAMKDAI